MDTRIGAAATALDATLFSSSLWLIAPLWLRACVVLPELLPSSRLPHDLENSIGLLKPQRRDETQRKVFVKMREHSLL